MKHAVTYGSSFVRLLIFASLHALGATGAKVTLRGGSVVATAEDQAPLQDALAPAPLAEAEPQDTLSNATLTESDGAIEDSESTKNQGPTPAELSAAIIDDTATAPSLDAQATASAVPASQGLAQDVAGDVLQSSRPDANADAEIDAVQETDSAPQEVPEDDGGNALGSGSASAGDDVVAVAEALLQPRRRHLVPTREAVLEPISEPATGSPPSVAPAGASPAYQKVSARQEEASVLGELKEAEALKPALADEGAEPLDNAMTLIRKKLAEAQKEEQRLHKLVSKALKWGESLKVSLVAKERENKQTIRNLVSKLHTLALAKGRVESELAQEKRRSTAASVALANASRNQEAEAQALQWVRRRLEAEKREDQSLKGALGNASAWNRKLTGQLAQNDHLREKADRSWHLAEARIHQVEAASEKTREDLRAVQDAKAKEDTQLKDIQHHIELQREENSNQEREKERLLRSLSQERADYEHLEAAKRMEDTQLESEKKLGDAGREHQQRLLNVAAQEKSAAEQRERQLLAEVAELKRQNAQEAAQVQAAQEARAREKKTYDVRLRAEVANETKTVAELRKEIDEVRSLKEQAAELRRRVDESDRARVEAESAAQRAEEARVQAEKEAKQLREAVPWLRAKVAEEQNMVNNATAEARFAREARDAAQAMLTDVRSGAAQLQQQYTNTVQALARAVGASERGDGPHDESQPKDAITAIGQLAGLTNLTVPSWSDSGSAGNATPPEFGGQAVQDALPPLPSLNAVSSGAGTQAAAASATPAAPLPEALGASDLPAAAQEGIEAPALPPMPLAEPEVPSASSAAPTPSALPPQLPTLPDYGAVAGGEADSGQTPAAQAPLPDLAKDSQGLSSLLGAIVSD